MTLPFSHAQFLDLLGDFNRVMWPVELLLWLATFAAAVQWLRGRIDPKVLSALLVVHWMWSGIAYHALYFTRVNPAAWLFAGLFVVAAALFGWFGLARGALSFDVGGSPRHLLAGGLIAYALAYPALALLSGLEWPRIPAFGVPCPTTLFTAGLLLAAKPPVPRWLFVIPIVWGFVGGSAALSLGIIPDFMLFAAAVAMLVCAVIPVNAAGTPAARRAAAGMA